MATTAVLTRLLDPEQYDVYGLPLIVMNLDAAIGFDWLGLSFLRFYQSRKDDPLVISTILQLFLGLVLLTVGLAALAMAEGVLHGREAPAILAGLLLMWSFSWFELTTKLRVGISIRGGTCA